MSAVHLLYFGRMSDVTGCAEEHYALPDSVSDVSRLRVWLDERYDGDGAFLDKSVRIAIDNEVLDDVDRFTAPREIAILPPVGGG